MLQPRLLADVPRTNSSANGLRVPTISSHNAIMSDDAGDMFVKCGLHRFPYRKTY